MTTRFLNGQWGAAPLAELAVPPEVLTPEVLTPEAEPPARTPVNHTVDVAEEAIMEVNGIGSETP